MEFHSQHWMCISRELSSKIAHIPKLRQSAVRAAPTKNVWVTKPTTRITECLPTVPKAICYHYEYSHSICVKQRRSYFNFTRTLVGLGIAPPFQANIRSLLIISHQQLQGRVVSLYRDNVTQGGSLARRLPGNYRCMEDWQNIGGLLIGPAC